MAIETPDAAYVRANGWCFSRVGGFDQVCLQSGQDLVSLEQLDQKLWAALSCPTQGLEFDVKTLELIDRDTDGRVRPPELIAAVKWAVSLLKNPDDLLKGEGRLPLAAINDASEEGRTVLASAKQILANLGKPDAPEITVEDTADTAKIFADARFNGDGVIPPSVAEDEAVRAVLEDALTCVPGETDLGGAPGLSRAGAEEFFKESREYVAWWDEVDGDPHGGLFRLFEKDGGAPESVSKLSAKLDDYFMRCRLAAMDPTVADALNPSVEDYRGLASRGALPAAESVAEFPVARIEAGAPVPLAEGVNPAWADLVAAFRSKVVLPILGERASLDASDWEGLREGFRRYEEWTARKKGTLVAKLGIDRVRDILSNNHEETVLALIQQDAAPEAEATAIASVRKLMLFYRDLNRLLNNFICFHDFYTPGFKAIFQIGSLYIDGRCCDLCVRVSDIAKHSGLATLSHTYLAYCECTRNGEKMLIAAAFTEGDSDNLLVGRNGVFYDRKGQDWDATIVKIVDHPISIRQAFWSPYKRIGRLVTEQIEKVAASRDKQVQTSAAGAAGAAAADAAKKPAAPAPPPQPFDVAKFAGVFAAIGLAIGSIGTAVASVVTGFMGLRWWQMPLAVAGIMLLVSGPSMILAYLNLRKRNLAPILDANGWAVNTKARINIPFGSSLTSMAKLPDEARRTTLLDPFAEKARPWKLYGVIAILLILLIFLLEQGYLVSWLKKLF